MQEKQAKAPDAQRNSGVDGEASSRWPGIAGKAAAGLLVAIFVFSLGVGVGDGRISISNKSANGSTSPNQLNYTSVDQVYDKLRENYDGNLDSTKLLDGMKKGLAEATGDPYTEYFTADEAKQFTEQVNGGGFSGIGAELGQDKDKNLVVVAPIDGTPAAKAGIKPQDIISAIDGKTTTGLSTDEAVSKIRGKKGTKVTLTVIRDHSQQLNIDIVRDDIRVPSVDSKVINDNIGYMRINTFGDDTGELAAQQAKDLKDKGVKGIVLDLRGNPGGEVDSAVKVASLWMPQGKLVMQAKRGSQVLDTYTANGNNILQGIPTAVLINEGSASASEIVTSALHDNSGARVIGTKSYGKGVMQGLEQLPGGAELKVTIARWYRPNGQNIDHKGITPDQNVELKDSDVSAGQDPQQDAAVQYVQSKMQ